MYIVLCVSILVLCTVVLSLLYHEPTPKTQPESEPEPESIASSSWFVCYHRRPLESFPQLHGFALFCFGLAMMGTLVTVQLFELNILRK